MIVRMHVDLWSFSIACAVYTFIMRLFVEGKMECVEN